MIKRNPSIRNQRSKGFKVKHVLQAILLLGVCFWLIYQVKHNHDKKKEFDKNDPNISVRTETDQVLKLGRKDLHPGKVEVDQNEKHEEEEEDEHVVDDVENKHEHDEHQQEGEDGNKHETEESEENVHEGREEHREEENKHGAEEEQEEDENKNEEIEDEGVDAETDENDHDKSDVDNDHDDEVVDDEKEKEDNDHDDEVVDDEKEKEEEGDETENEDKEDEEKGGLVENHENHEAREEHYKGDDASSAVTHDTHSTSTETETINLEHAGLSVQMNTVKPENETTYHSDESNKKQNDSDSKFTEGEVTDAISSNATAGKEAGNDGSSVSDETAKTNTDSHLNVSSNSTAVITEAISTGDDASSSSEQIKTAILSESDHAQNATVNTTITGDIKQAEGLEQGGNKTSEGNLPDNNATVSAKPENQDAAPQESSTLVASVLEKTEGSVASNGTENIFNSLDRSVSSNTTESDKSEGSMETSEASETQNVDVTEDEMFKGDSQTSETDEKSDSSSTTEILDAVVHDAIDSSDSHDIHEDMAKARTDLDTLPDIISEGNESDENAAE